jgi:hypothetical protein
MEIRRVVGSLEVEKNGSCTLEIKTAVLITGIFVLDDKILDFINTIIMYVII